MNVATILRELFGVLCTGDFSLVLPIFISMNLLAMTNGDLFSKRTAATREFRQGNTQKSLHPLNERYNVPHYLNNVIDDKLDLMSAAGDVGLDLCGVFNLPIFSTILFLDQMHCRWLNLCRTISLSFPIKHRPKRKQSRRFYLTSMQKLDCFDWPHRISMKIRLQKQISK